MARKKKKASVPMQSPQLPQEQNAPVIPANLPLRNSQDLQGARVTEIPIIKTYNHIWSIQWFNRLVQRLPEGMR